MLCVRVPLTDRRLIVRQHLILPSTSRSLPDPLDENHTYHRCCVAKKLQKLDHQDHPEGEDESIKSTTTTTTSTSSSSGRRSAREISFPPKTTLMVSLLDMPDDTKTLAPLSVRLRKTLRVPHNFQQYQQTIINKSIETFNRKAQEKDKEFPDIFVKGSEIRNPNIHGSASITGEDDFCNIPDLSIPILENSYQMDEKGDTTISFYDFHRTFSFEDELDLDLEDDSSDDQKVDPERILCESPSTAAPLKYSRIQAPSPKTKQIIRVNVIRVTNQ